MKSTRTKKLKLALKIMFVLSVLGAIGIACGNFPKQEKYLKKVQQALKAGDVALVHSQFIDQALDRFPTPDSFATAAADAKNRDLSLWALKPVELVDYSSIRYRAEIWHVFPQGGVPYIHLDLICAGFGAGTCKIEQIRYPKEEAQALIQAIESNDAQKFEALLDKGVDVNLSNEEGNTPLMVAVSHPEFDYNFVEKLIQGGTKFYQRNKKKQSAMDIAKSIPENRFVQELKNAGVKE